MAETMELQVRTLTIRAAAQDIVLQRLMQVIWPMPEILRVEREAICGFIERHAEEAALIHDGRPAYAVLGEVEALFARAAAKPAIYHRGDDGV